MPAKKKITRSKWGVPTFVSEGIEIPIWPARGKGRIPIALIRKAVRAALAEEKAEKMRKSAA